MTDKLDRALIEQRLIAFKRVRPQVFIPSNTVVSDSAHELPLPGDVVAEHDEAGDRSGSAEPHQEDARCDQLERKQDRGEDHPVPRAKLSDHFQGPPHTCTLSRRRTKRRNLRPLPPCG
ncbi:MAG: hypothetical protein ACREDO_12660 [Methyloceanibacter sp.]